MERDIVEILYELETAKPGGPIPDCLKDDEEGNWGVKMSKIAGRARATIIELRRACGEMQ